jgi:hypothetical protein
MKLRNRLLAAGFAAVIATPAYAQTIVTQTSGRLTLTTPNNDQSVKVEVGPIIGSVRVFGFPGLSDGQQYSGVSGLTVLTGAGKDAVEVVAETPASFDISIDTGTGESEAKVKWKLLAGGASNTATVDINSDTAGSQIAIVEIDSEAANSSITVRAPSASDSTTIIQSSNLSNFLSAFVQSAAPKSAVSISSSANTLQLDLRGGSSSRPNELSYAIAQARSGAVSVNWGLTGSGADDKIEAKVSAPGSAVTQRGNIRSFAGSDLIQFETEAFSTISGLTLNGGDGNDFLLEIIKGRLQLSQTLQTRLLGGAGDDELTLTTDTGIFGTGLPNDLTPLIDCGAGVDRFNAFGLIRNCESRL